MKPTKIFVSPSKTTSKDTEMLVNPEAVVEVPEPVSRSSSGLKPLLTKSGELISGMLENIAERQQRLALQRQEMVRSHSKSKSGLIAKQLKPNPSQSENEKPEARKLSKPIFMFSIGVIYVSFLVGEIIYNRGFERFQKNPFFGPSSETLIYFGAQYGPLIFKRGQYYRY